MTQDERWLTRFNEVMTFIETNHRNPSKYFPEERLIMPGDRSVASEFNNGVILHIPN